jgi:hypothetical protein
MGVVLTLASSAPAVEPSVENENENAYAYAHAYEKAKASTTDERRARRPEDDPRLLARRCRDAFS